jgi:hypothetical protein
MSSVAEPAAGTTGARAPVAASSAESVAATGWITFSGVMIIVAGFLNLVDGLWALDVSDSAAVSDEVEELLWYNDNLETWGWIYTVVGLALILVGVGVFTRSNLARWIGVGAASVSMVVNMMWVFVYPIPALIHVVVAGMVIYGLTAYEPPAPAGSGAEDGW